MIGGAAFPVQQRCRLRLCVGRSELGVTGQIDGRWTLTMTDRPGRFGLELMETDSGGLLVGEGATLADAVNSAAKGSR